MSLNLYKMQLAERLSIFDPLMKDLSKLLYVKFIITFIVF